MLIHTVLVLISNYGFDDSSNILIMNKKDL